MKNYTFTFTLYDHANRRLLKSKHAAPKLADSFAHFEAIGLKVVGIEK